MLVVGAKGFAKEILEVLNQLGQLENLVFYDDVNDDINGLLFNKFPILKNIEDVSFYFRNVDNRFTIGIGNPILRKKIYEKFTALGGALTSTISKSQIGSYDVEIGMGSNILFGVTISNSVKIGVGSILYYNSIITHDCIIGNFVEVSPGVIVLGRCTIGNYCQIGANSTILPDISIGTNVIIGAGSVITRDVPDNSIVVGTPGRVIKKQGPLSF